MCSAVQFAYRCGCVENTTFECPDTTTDPYNNRHCSGPGAVMITALDEKCFDCSEDIISPPSAAPAGVLQERDINLPTKISPIPPWDFFEDMSEWLNLWSSA
ncbi:hypothetical protein F4806DRAFT_499699 [Annulohypoxylon nitens]|nr:hypothetical protein F4806DRAFT_499699 [Annulohypoxylon nitens]